MFLCSLLLIAADMAPVSSDTIITTASVSSVRPIPALCLVPRVFEMSLLKISGRKQPAAMTLFPLMVPDNFDVVHPEDLDYYTRSRRAWLGKTRRR